MSEKALNAIIIDDNPAFREFLRGLLSQFDFIRVSAETDSAEKALAAVEEEPPQLMIADIRLPGMGGLELAGVLKERFPGTKVILITLYDNDRYRRETDRLGYTYIPKSLLLERLPLLLKKLGDEREGVLSIKADKS